MDKFGLGHIPEDSGVMELVDKAIAKQLDIKISCNCSEPRNFIKICDECLHS